MTDELLERLTSRFRRLAELREAQDEAKVVQKRTAAEYREYEAELWEELNESPLKGSLKFDLGPPHGTIAFERRETYYGRVLDADQAIDYFETRGLSSEMLRKPIDKGKLNEIVREYLDNGKGPPPGLDFYAQRYIAMSKEKN